MTTKKTNRQRGPKITKPDNKRLYIHSNPRFTTRGVENICVLEEAQVYHQQPKDEDDDEGATSTNLGSVRLD